MYKHKPGIQMDEYGFNESKNITGKKNPLINRETKITAKIDT